MKKNIIVYVLILILAIALTGSITYLVMSRNNNNETNVQEKEDLNVTDEEIKVTFENFMKLKNTFIGSPSEMLRELGYDYNILEKYHDLELYENNYVKTDILYSDFENKILNYMTKELFQKEFKYYDNVEAFKNIGGYLYYVSWGSSGSGSKLESITKNNDGTYKAKIYWYDMDKVNTDEAYYITFKIEKYNGKCVISEYIEEYKSKYEVEITEKEINEKISYIPKNTSNSDSINAYRKSMTVLDLNDKTIIQNVLLNLIQSKLDSSDYFKVNDYTFDYRFSLSEVTDMAKKMYNYNKFQLESYEITTTLMQDKISDIGYDVNGVMFVYSNDYFYGYISYTEPDTEHMSLLEDYTTTSNELIIIERASYYMGGEMGDNNCEYPAYLSDYYTTYRLTIPYKKGKSGYCEYEYNNVKEYFKEHKTEFTKYKHTYKKNDTGYYWYSTEVVE